MIRRSRPSYSEINQLWTWRNVSDFTQLLFMFTTRQISARKTVLSPSGNRSTNRGRRRVFRQWLVIVTYGLIGAEHCSLNQDWFCSDSHSSGSRLEKDPGLLLGRKIELFPKNLSWYERTELPKPHQIFHSTPVSLSSNCHAPDE